MDNTNCSRAPEWEQLQGVLGFAADWIWEQDTRFCFTRLAGEVMEGEPDRPWEELLGHSRWELDLSPVVGCDWEFHRALLKQHRPFRGLILRRDLPDDTIRWVRINGVPSFDSAGRWTGYRGTGEDITASYERTHTDRLFRAIVEALPDSITLSDPETQRLLYGNKLTRELTGFSQEELQKLCGYQLTGTSSEVGAQVLAASVKAGDEGYTQATHFGQSRDGGRKGWWEPHHRGFQLDGRWYVASSSRDVTRRVMAEKAAERAKRMYAALSATTEVVMRARTTEEMYQGVCDAAVSAGGLPFAAILVADSGGEYLHPAAASGIGKKQIQKTVISISPKRPEGQGLNGIAFRSGEPCVSNDFQHDPRTKPWHGLARQIQLKSGAAIPLMRDGKSVGVLYLCAAERRIFDGEVVSLLQKMAQNLVYGMQTLDHEVDRERAEQRLRYLATHDTLTGLPNRTLFGELLDQAATTARRYEQGLAVMFIDLDRFKLINDSLGHAAGDILLKEMSSRLRATLRASDVLARMGGDEFVVLLQNVKHGDDAAVVARKLLDAALQPLTVMGQECRVTTSIGISLYPEHGLEHNELMKHADTAMYLAKEKGKNTFEFYTPGMQSQANERLSLESALRNAMGNNEFSLHYQAKLNLKTNKISGVEALLRWQHPTIGNISPAQFIPLCEENGMIVPLGRWVLYTACKQNVEWQRQGLPRIAMAVNLSARQFNDPRLLDDVKDALNESDMDPSLLELELTESMVMLNPVKTIAILTELRALGVRIALDDFGVGYSSLAQIKGFPIDTLKVDRSFIRNLPESVQDCAITQAIINMARSLSLNVVAEGVETQAQESYLRGLSCDESQGFYFSKPASADVFCAFLKSHGVESQ